MVNVKHKYFGPLGKPESEVHKGIYNGDTGMS